VRGAFIVPRAFALLSLPQSKRHRCDSIATMEHSVGGLNGGLEPGATAADGDIDGTTVGDVDADRLGSGATVVGAQAVTTRSNPTARRRPPKRMTEP
jgi:hypothetical protein